MLSDIESDEHLIPLSIASERFRAFEIAGSLAIPVSAHLTGVVTRLITFPEGRGPKSSLTTLLFFIMNLESQSHSPTRTAQSRGNVKVSASTFWSSPGYNQGPFPPRLSHSSPANPCERRSPQKRYHDCRCHFRCWSFDREAKV